MPILGIMASSRPAFELVGSYDSLATVTLSAATASITFSGIPSGYKHLQIRHISLTGVLAGDVRLQFNSDTSSNYSLHQIYGDGSAAAASGSANTTYIPIGVSGNTTYPGNGIVDILDYANTNKNKTTRSLHGVDVNGAGGYLFFTSGNWRNTNAVTSITLFINGYNINQYSSFALYGVR
jgi:hypothetical protein